MPDSPSKSPLNGPRIAALAFLGVVGLLLIAQSSGPSNPTPASSPTDPIAAQPDPLEPIGTPPAEDLAALLNGLTLGHKFDEWKIVNFFPTDHKVVWIELSKNGQTFGISISARGTLSRLTPAQTDRYELGYGMVRPVGISISPDEMTKYVAEIAQRIRQRENEVPLPKGL